MGIYVELRFQRPKSDYKQSDRLHIDLRYYYKGRRTRIASGVEVCIKDFSTNLKSGWVKRLDKDYQSKNIRIRSRITEVETIIQKLELEGLVPLPQLVKKGLQRVDDKKVVISKSELDYFNLVDDYLKWVSKSVELSPLTKKKIRSSCKSITDYLRDVEGVGWFPMDGFDRSWIDEFKNHMLGVRRLNNSTIQKYLKQLSTLVNWSRNRGYTSHKLPPLKIQLPEREIIYLNRDELTQLFEFTDYDFVNPKHSQLTKSYVDDELRGRKKVQTNDEVELDGVIYRRYTQYEVYLDLLLFLSGVGCRFGDVVKLKVDDVKYPSDSDPSMWLNMLQEKTGKVVRIPFNHITHTIFRKYSRGKTREQFIFPLTERGNQISNQKFNQNIKVICQKVGLNRLVKSPKYVGSKIKNGTDIRVPLYEVVSSHIGRRTFIREGLNSNLPHHIIRSMTGHQSDKVFGLYFNTLQEEQEMGMSKMFRFDFNIEEETPPSPPSKSDDVTHKLKELKELFDKGLIPIEVYYQKVSDLI